MLNMPSNSICYLPGLVSKASNFHFRALKTISMYKDFISACALPAFATEKIISAHVFVHFRDHGNHFPGLENHFSGRGNRFSGRI